MIENNYCWAKAHANFHGSHPPKGGCNLNTKKRLRSKSFLKTRIRSPPVRRSHPLPSSLITRHYNWTLNIEHAMFTGFQCEQRSTIEHDWPQQSRWRSWSYPRDPRLSAANSDHRPLTPVHCPRVCWRVGQWDSRNLRFAILDLRLAERAKPLFKNHFAFYILPIASSPAVSQSVPRDE